MAVRMSSWHTCFRLLPIVAMLGQEVRPTSRAPTACYPPATLSRRATRRALAFCVPVVTASSLRTVVLAALVVGLMALPTRGRAQDAVGGCGDPSAPFAEVQIDTYPHIDLELARTPQEHELGLMYREFLPPDSGMLFVYQADSREGYWMYHTLIPLSIAWIDRDGTIVDIQDMPRLIDPNAQQATARTVYNPAAPDWYGLDATERWTADPSVRVGQPIT